MTTAQIIESVKAIRNQIAIIENQVETDSTLVQEGTLEACIMGCTGSTRQCTCND